VLAAEMSNMKFSLLHISDLHRDLTDEIGNDWLLDSLEKDFGFFHKQDPKILAPSIAIVSGDLVYGVQPGIPDVYGELERQYTQAQEFLSALAQLTLRSRPYQLKISCWYVACWHIASFRCDADFGRYRGIADIDQAAPINLDL
jgi:hypothetical protein